MKFFDCSTAPSPRRVRIFLAEKGVEIETVQVDLRNGEQFSADFQKINPDCVVPALQLDDGSCLSEVLPICHFLEARFPEPALLGSTDIERAQVLMWNVKAEQQGLLAAAEAFRNRTRGFKDRAMSGPVSYAQIPELAERGKERLLQFYRRIDSQLASSEYLAGTRYSIADISAMVAVDFGAWIKVDIPDDAPHTRRWYEQVSARPSAAV
ncbi:MAG: glutathione S-transferase [Gammaproteobacteria bacterium]|nr:glutathione S-transferase [Gammaproteobacteria bacterium]